MTIAKTDGMRGLIENLHAEIPEQYISYRPQGGGRVAFLSWQSVALALDAITAAHGGSWDTQVQSAVITGKQAVVTVRLTIRTPDGQQVARESVGTADMDTPSAAHAPPMEVAERVAFRRAAGLFGLSLPPQQADQQAPQQAAPVPSADRHIALAERRKQARQLPDAYSEYDDCPECGAPKKAPYPRCYDCHQARTL